VSLHRRQTVRQVCLLPGGDEVYLVLQLSYLVFSMPEALPLSQHPGASLLTILQDLQEQADINDTLRTQLAQAKTESAEKGSVRPPSLIQYLAPPNAQQVELQAEVESLRRENKLIMSAWYDMTTRLQSNTVILQRKSEAPKSWLGKQRVVVGGTSTLGRR
jgi:protein HOOK3